MEIYDSEFYRDRHKKTRTSAKIILSIIQQIIPRLKSAVDVGCGVGTWLSVLKERGVEDIKGIDGCWVNKDYLVIERHCFMEHDLKEKIILNKRYDLAISLEVAEHLSSENAKLFVSSLTNLSDFVLFSAAIPGQIGVNHLNEQWLDYWIAFFREQGYVGLDVVRRKIWNNKSIPFPYRQNTLLFVKKEEVSNLKFQGESSVFNPISVVHPDFYLHKMDSMTIKQTFRLFVKAAKRRIIRELKIRKRRI